MPLNFDPNALPNYRPRLRLRGQYNLCSQMVDLYLIETNDHDGSRSIARTITMEPMRNGYNVDPSFRLEDTAAQELMDTLWQCGLRPTEGKGSAGALAAMEQHLDDLRTMLFTHHKIPVKSR